jgi:hypothetical protein
MDMAVMMMCLPALGRLDQNRCNAAQPIPFALKIKWWEGGEKKKIIT